MRKKIYSIILILTMMFMAVACSKMSGDVSNKEEETKKASIEDQMLEMILESEHVLNNMAEFSLDKVTGELSDIKNEDDEAKVECKLTYSSKYVEMKETIKCYFEKTDSDWKLDRVRVKDEIEYSKRGTVYYLNYKPELDYAWQELAREYEALTGVNVKVVTAANGVYNSVLDSELTKDVVPTLFHVSGYVDLEKYKDYCYDLSGSDAYKELTSDSYALKDGNGVYGISYSIETYGIITNKTLLSEAGYSVDQIKSFDDLKNIAEDIYARSEELGFTAFASTGMDMSSDWRFKTHLANVPIYFEYQTDGINHTTELKGTYLDNYRDIFDLYINNSTCSPDEIGYMTGDDAINEFLNKEAVFYQNGSWVYGELTRKELHESELTMIPIYIGVGDEAKQGLCTGSEHYWCVNKNASEQDINATLDFINWCVSSETGTKYMYDEMGLVIPYDKAVESKNLFVKIDAANTAAGLVPVTWTFDTMPSESWKNNVGYALTAYAADQSDDNWDKVVEAFVSGWEDEWDLKK